MDTRTKIVPAAEAARLASAGAVIVSGYFDPLLAAHAEQLRQLKQAGVPLLVAIAEPRSPILPARARAELVAALAAVDYVAETLDGLEPQRNLESQDERRLEDLIAHVHARQRAAS